MRPSYVLGGRAMEIVYDDASLEHYMRRAVWASPERPVLIDRFIEDAIEVDVDMVSDGRTSVIGGILEFLSASLLQLSTSLNAGPITRDNLPAGVARNWFLPDGRVRVEALPGAAAQTTQGLQAFSAAVLKVAPDAGGPAISTIATAGTILNASREAAVLAFVAIAVILFVVFRTVRVLLLVLATLALSALLTALFAWMARMSINYANIIALPLLLGVGVSFNVYFVMNFRVDEEFPLLIDLYIQVVIASLRAQSRISFLIFT